MQPDMLIAALPTDLHLYARPPPPCSIPASAYVLATDAAHSAAAQQTTVRGAFLRPTSQPDPGVKHLWVRCWSAHDVHQRGRQTPPSRKPRGWPTRRCPLQPGRPQHPGHLRRQGGPAAVWAGAPGESARGMAQVVDRFPRAAFARAWRRSPTPSSAAATTRAAGAAPVEPRRTSVERHPSGWTPPEGGVVYSRRILRRRPRADLHLDFTARTRSPGRQQPGERPAALRRMAGSAQGDLPAGRGRYNGQAAGRPEGSVATEQWCTPAERTRQYGHADPQKQQAPGVAAGGRSDQRVWRA